MIKAAGRTGDGTPLLVLGLTGENMTRLMAGEPITFTTADLPGAVEAVGMPAVQVILVGGRDDAAVTKTLQAQGLLASS